MLVDTHCHLDSKPFTADREAAIERALAAGVDHLVAIGTGDGPPDLEAGLRLAEAYPFISATVGVHPHDAAKATPETWLQLASLCAHPKCVMVGEIGLDYHYDFSPRETQRAAFIEQLRIARAASLPICIHTREAWPDTIEILKEHWDPALGGIFHCFSGGPDEARLVLDMGFHVSFSGIVTFPKALDLQAAARLVPDERILVETDAPYLAPVPYRGKRNEPAYVVETARFVAHLRGMDFEAFAALSSANFRALCLRQARSNG